MTSHVNVTFGKYIKRLRTENELTLTQLAAKLDLDPTNLDEVVMNNYIPFKQVEETSL